MEIVKVKINDLISPDYNPRTITDEELSKLKDSLEEFGYISPIIVNQHNNHIVGGNQRYECLKALGYDEIDVIYINEPDLQREKALNIRLNNLSGEWDTGKLETIFNEFESTGFNTDLTGFNTDNLQGFHTNDNESKTENNEDISEHENDEYAGGLSEEEVSVKIGDVYLLGDHKLMCGDSSNKENIDILINQDTIDLILTDPPYGLNIVNTSGKIGGGKPVTINQEQLEPQANSDSNRERERAFDRNRGRPRRRRSQKIQTYIKRRQTLQPSDIIGVEC